MHRSESGRMSSSTLLHATIALFVNEFQSALLDDVASILQEADPGGGRGTSMTIRTTPTATVKMPTPICATLLGGPIALRVADGEVLPGEYQRVILAELATVRASGRPQVQIVGE